MRFPAQRCQFEGLTTKLYQNDLHYYRKDNNKEEHVIVEEVLKDIQFRTLQFSTVDFIEDLHEDKSVEEYAKVLTVVKIPLFLPKSVGDRKNYVTGE